MVFLHPLKTSEILYFSDISRGDKIEQLTHFPEFSSVYFIDSSTWHLLNYQRIKYDCRNTITINNNLIKIINCIVKLILNYQYCLKHLQNRNNLIWYQIIKNHKVSDY